MSYFDISSEVVKTVVSSTQRMSQTSMNSSKMCYEFVWESGSGKLGCGIGISSNVYVRLDSAGSFGTGGVSCKSNTGDSIPIVVNEPIMICFDKSDISNYNLTAIKGTKKRTFIFMCSSATQQSEWRIFTYNCDSSSYSDNVELRLSKKKMTHTIPTGFSPWFGSIGNIRRYSCGRNSSFTKLPFVYIFIVRS